jgi:co-chaperonin GroES (HSP10)
MSKFVPFDGKVEVRPIEKNSIIQSEDKVYVESGEVIAKSDSCTGFVKVGDILFFDSWKCSIAKEQDGTEHYVVTLDGEGTLGKIEK